MSHVITITIGRNVGTTPLGADEWDSFQSTINRVAEHVRNQYVATAYMRELDGFTLQETGQGSWDGVVEDNYTVKIFTELAVEAEIIADLKASLSKIALNFGQDAISLMVGGSFLVQAPVVEGV